MIIFAVHRTSFTKQMYEKKKIYNKYWRYKILLLKILDIIHKFILSTKKKSIWGDLRGKLDKLKKNEEIWGGVETLYSVNQSIAVSIFWNIYIHFKQKEKWCCKKMLLQSDCLTMLSPELDKTNRVYILLVPAVLAPWMRYSAVSFRTASYCF